MLQSRHGNGNGIGAEQHLSAAPWGQKIGITHAEIQSDHVLRRGHPCVKLRRARMIATPRAYPSDAGLAGFLDSQFGGAFHNQMPQSIVAVEECRTNSVAQYPNVGPRIDSPAL